MGANSYQTPPTPDGDPDDECMTYDATKLPQPADLRPWPEQVNERIVALESAVNRLTDEVEYIRKKQS